MNAFKLPHTTRVQRVIPKNAFDKYVSAKQKKLLTEKVSRITWLNKISTDTVKLEAKDIKEIQIFKIELRTKDDISEILDLIDKSIPYNIIFIVECEQEMYLSTSAKHGHPNNINKAVIDWTFKSQWLLVKENSHTLNLKKSIDAVFLEFCHQLSGTPANQNKSLSDLVNYCNKKDILEKEIYKLKRDIKNCKQYKLKVEMNLELKKLKEDLQRLTSAE